MITIDPPDESLDDSWVTAMRRFLARAQRAIPIAGGVSVLLTTDREMRRLNRIFRRQDHSTDVLSFPAAPIQHPSSKSDIFSGDLAISLDTARRQAGKLGHSLEVELKILLMHGLLHLAGYDHEADEGEMARREENLRRRFRLPIGLTARGAPGRAKLREGRQ